jgi:hypothetical protein
LPRLRHPLRLRQDQAPGRLYDAAKGATLHNLECDTIALFALMLFAMTIAVTRFRRTLD